MQSAVPGYDSPGFHRSWQCMPNLQARTWLLILSDNICISVEMCRISTYSTYLRNRNSSTRCHDDCTTTTTNLFITGHSITFVCILPILCFSNQFHGLLVLCGCHGMVNKTRNINTYAYQHTYINKQTKMSPYGQVYIVCAVCWSYMSDAAIVRGNNTYMMWEKPGGQYFGAYMIC